MKNKKKGIIVLAILVVLVIVYYFYLSNRDIPQTDEDVETTRVQEILLKNISKNYPATPKEVVKLYSDITQCFYQETYTEDELYRLVKMSYQMFDTDLQDKNPLDTYYSSLVNEIQDYKDNNYVISAYSTSSSVDIENEKFVKDGYTCTKVYTNYTMRRGTVITTINEVFVLRKDKSGYWRILGWDLVDDNAE